MGNDVPKRQASPPPSPPIHSRSHTQPPPPTPSTPTPHKALTEQPWRKIKGWNEGVRTELKDKIATATPQTRGQLDVQFLNIALTGQIGAGKSSFLNSVNSIFKDEICGTRAEVGCLATSLTTEYRVYEITPKDHNNPLSWRICDTMGFDTSKTNDVENILEAIEGHVPNEFLFPDNDAKINEETTDYIATPKLKDKAHCVAIVVDGKSFPNMETKMKEKLQTLRKGLIDRKIPSYILLTHIDEACDEVAKDVKNVYRSVVIRDLLTKVGKMLNGLPENQIFPLVNYKKQVELQDDMDILMMYALRQMLGNAQGHLKNQIKLAEKQTVAQPNLPLSVQESGENDLKMK